MRRGVPLAPVIATVVCITATNVLVAQVLVATLYPAARFRLGLLVLIGLLGIALVSGASAVVTWRGYLRRRRGG